MEWTARSHAEHSSLGVEQIEQREEIALVSAASMEEGEQPVRLADGRANQMREWLRRRHGARLTLREPTENGAEQRMAPRRLREGASVREQRGHARLAASRVEAVDEEAERIQGDVLCQRHSDRELPALDGDALPGLVEGESEERSVQQCESQGQSHATQTRG